VTFISSVCRIHSITICRNYGPIRSFKLIINQHASYIVLHHSDGLITNILIKIVDKHRMTSPSHGHLGSPIMEVEYPSHIHNAIIWVSHPFNVHSPAFMPIACKRIYQVPFLPYKDHRHYTIINKQSHDNVP
jgi:hypothetical protein